jgi:RimJ/RimL family protein N-acetyltransferase
MLDDINEFAQRLGAPVPHWQAPPHPAAQPIEGLYCHLEPLKPAHASDLFQHLGATENLPGWTYLPYGPFVRQGEFTHWIETQCGQNDPVFYALLSPQKIALGLASYLRITPEAGSIEVGHLHFAPAMARTPMATEALYWLIKQAFDWGYRRCEWKCNALNLPSRRAAQRLGLSFEGLFRQAAVIKGRNRDTAWFAATDADWPALEEALLSWLQPKNFTEEGQQLNRLSELTAPLLINRDPALA